MSVLEPLTKYNRYLKIGFGGWRNVLHVVENVLKKKIIKNKLQTFLNNNGVSIFETFVSTSTKS